MHTSKEIYFSYGSNTIQNLEITYSLSRETNHLTTSCKSTMLTYCSINRNDALLRKARIMAIYY